MGNEIYELMEHIMPDQTGRSLQSLILEACDYAKEMQVGDSNRSFCVTRGAVIAKRKNNETKGHDCWFELVAYWDDDQKLGRVKFIPLLSGYFFGDTSLTEDFIDEVKNCPFHNFGFDTITFTKEDQPPKLKLSPSAAKQFCTVPNATYIQPYDCKLIKFIDDDGIKLIDISDNLYQTKVRPEITGEEWNHYSYGFREVLNWDYVKRVDPYDESFQKAVECEASFMVAPILWLAAPKDSHFMLSLVGGPTWRHGNYDHIARTSCNRFHIEYVQSSEIKRLWNYVRVDKFDFD